MQRTGLPATASGSTTSAGNLVPPAALEAHRRATVLARFSSMVVVQQQKSTALSALNIAERGMVRLAMESPITQRGFIFSIRFPVLTLNWSHCEQPAWFGEPGPEFPRMRLFNPFSVAICRYVMS